MERVDFDSRALAWVHYLEPQQILRVGLRSGRVYDYFKVPVSVYNALLAAPSKGIYYNSHIRNDFLYIEVRTKTAN